MYFDYPIINLILRYLIISLLHKFNDMNHIEANEFRPIYKFMNPNADFDKTYTFYYDETNNIKKLHLKKGDFNYAFSSNFVLGGLAYKGAAPDISDIFSGLQLQASVNEVKLKHIAKGDFLWWSWKYP